MRTSAEILIDLKSLVKSSGYIYALCLIIFENSHIHIEELHNVDYRSRLTRNEITLLLGFLVKSKINTDYPDSPRILSNYKVRTYKLMKELHSYFMSFQFEKLLPIIEKSALNNNFSAKDFFHGENMFVEPIFYSGDGIYDIQYLSFLKRKYKHDEKWLNENTSFYFDSAIEIAKSIKVIHSTKSKKINFLSITENKDKILSKLRKRRTGSGKDFDRNKSEYLFITEILQYSNLFKNNVFLNKEFSLDDISSEDWIHFYDNLLDLFIISKSDFKTILNIDQFIKNFSIEPNDNSLNKDFNSVGDFNIFNAKPIITLQSDKYFLPNSFSLFEAVYESPYYWMLGEKSYCDTSAINRGKVGEEIVYELLSKVFGEENTYKSVIVESKKGYHVTDIDVLCILGNKVLCVQVKSKKLTQLSRRGNEEQLKKDFKGAVQDAYEQGLISRKRILENTATFYTEDRKKINILKNIDEVYILGITTENYPTLTHQSHVLLQKADKDPYPLFLTIFDLDLIIYYISNPYKFLHYIHQRIELLDYFLANEEVHFLGYHLTEKLCINHRQDFIIIDGCYGQLIDRNYYPIKSGLKVSNHNDIIENRWVNKNFDSFCEQIESTKSPKVVDIIFHFLDWSNNSIDDLIQNILEYKYKSIQDGKMHNFSIVPGPLKSSFGCSFFSSLDTNLQELDEKLYNFARLKKYNSEADTWIVFGCLANSNKMVDSITLIDEKWEYDEILENEAMTFFGNNKQKIQMRLGKKIGRNDYCPCGSKKKYKKCCNRYN